MKFLNYLDDILLATGLATVIIATFLLSVVPYNIIAGLYTLGTCLFGVGVWFVKYPLKKD